MSRSVGLRRIGVDGKGERSAELLVQKQLPERLLARQMVIPAKLRLPLLEEKGGDGFLRLVRHRQLAGLRRIQDGLVDRHHVEVRQVAAEFQAVALHERQVGDLGHLTGDLLAHVIEESWHPANQFREILLLEALDADLFAGADRIFARDAAQRLGLAEHIAARQVADRGVRAVAG